MFEICLFPFNFLLGVYSGSSSSASFLFVLLDSVQGFILLVGVVAGVTPWSGVLGFCRPTKVLASGGASIFASGASPRVLGPSFCVIPIPSFWSAVVSMESYF